MQVSLTEGSIRVRSCDKMLTILPAPRPCPANLAQPASADEAEADFIVDLDEILCWDPPNDSVEIEIEELLDIVRALETEFERLGLVIEFD
jgi:Immunity protein 74